MIGVGLHSLVGVFPHQSRGDEVPASQTTLGFGYFPLGFALTLGLLFLGGMHCVVVMVVVVIVVMRAVVSVCMSVFMLESD